MGKVTGFLEYNANCRRGVRSRSASTTGLKFTRTSLKIASERRAPAAWIAACHSATTDVRWAI